MLNIKDFITQNVTYCLPKGQVHVDANVEYKHT